MFAAALDLEKKFTPDPGRVGDRSLRILIPRTMLSLYEIRNNRGVGHVGGDVNPNLLDATAVYQMASWILAEIIRVFHGITTAQAQDIVDVIIERKIPLIWVIEGTKRVLSPAMQVKDQVLTLLHQSLTWVGVDDLFNWTEYSNKSVFKNSVLAPLHAARLLEFQKTNMRARISPLGTQYVEEKLLPS